jgi:hypothetical protein
MTGVVLAPDLIGAVVLRAWEFGGTIDAVPVGRVVTFEIGESPVDIHFAKHGEVGGGVGDVRVKKRAIPVEEDAAESRRC